MEIVLLVILFLVGSIGGAVQAMKYLERRETRRRTGTSSPDRPSGGHRP